MGTRSSITAKMTDGTFKSVYCHFDGYLSHNGEKLVSHYSTQEKIEELLSHGDMSALYERCDAPEGHSFDTPVEGCTKYYGRDRGEQGTDARTGATYEEAVKGNKQEYNYLWDGEKWTVASWFSDGKFVDLEEAVASKADEEE